MLRTPARVRRILAAHVSLRRGVCAAPVFGLKKLSAKMMKIAELIATRIQRP